VRVLASAELGCLLYFNVDYLDVFERLVGSVGANVLDLVHDVHSLGDTAKDRVFVVQAVDRHGRNEELATVGVGSSVGHRQRARTIVAQRWVELVFKVLAPDTRSASTIT